MTIKRQRAGAADERTREAGPRPMHISLRAGERLFLNGAVLRVDRKVSLEILNDATFLLENHVLRLEETHTPVRQLYFAAQAMLMDPQNAAASRALFDSMAVELKSELGSPVLREGIVEAQALIAGGRAFQALKVLRALFDEEAALLGLGPAAEPRSAAPDASSRIGPASRRADSACAELQWDRAPPRPAAPPIRRDTTGPSH